MDYSQLSDNARVHLKGNELPTRLKFYTRKHYLIRAWTYILILPIAASLVMALYLDGKEQLFYQLSVLVLVASITGLYTLKHQLVFDRTSNTRYTELTLLRYSIKRSQPAPLNNTQLLIRRASHRASIYELKIDEYSYPIGSLTETLQALIFISHTFQLEPREQISQYPDIRPIQSDPLNFVDRATAETTHSARQPLDITPLWRPINFVMLFAPLPPLLIIGFTIKFFVGE
jgi:hypothetical protein